MGKPRHQDNSPPPSLQSKFPWCRILEGSYHKYLPNTWWAGQTSVTLPGILSVPSQASGQPGRQTPQASGGASASRQAFVSYSVTSVPTTVQHIQRCFSNNCQDQ
jgi:hypothetical protein